MDRNELYSFIDQDNSSERYDDLLELADGGPVGEDMQSEVEPSVQYFADGGMATMPMPKRPTRMSAAQMLRRYADGGLVGERTKSEQKEIFKQFGAGAAVENLYGSNVGMPKVDTTPMKFNFDIPTITSTYTPPTGPVGATTDATTTLSTFPSGLGTQPSFTFAGSQQAPAAGTAPAGTAKSLYEKITPADLGAKPATFNLSSGYTPTAQTFAKPELISTEKAILDQPKLVRYEPDLFYGGLTTYKGPLNVSPSTAEQAAAIGGATTGGATTGGTTTGGTTTGGTTTGGATTGGATTGGATTGGATTGGATTGGATTGGTTTGGTTTGGATIGGTTTGGTTTGGATTGGAVTDTITGGGTTATTLPPGTTDPRVYNFTPPTTGTTYSTNPSLWVNPTLAIGFFSPTGGYKAPGTGWIEYTDYLNQGLYGQDTATAGAGTDTVTAGAGTDTVTAGAGTDTVTAGPGIDTTVAGTGIDTTVAGAGTDTVTDGTGGTTITGAGPGTVTQGVTTVPGAGPGSVVSGESGADVLAGGTGAVGAGGTGTTTPTVSYKSQIYGGLTPEMLSALSGRASDVKALSSSFKNIVDMQQADVTALEQEYDAAIKRGDVAAMNVISPVLSAQRQELATSKADLAFLPKLFTGANKTFETPEQYQTRLTQQFYVGADKKPRELAAYEMPTADWTAVNTKTGLLANNPMAKGGAFAQAVTTQDLDVKNATNVYNTMVKSYGKDSPAAKNFFDTVLKPQQDELAQINTVRKNAASAYELINAQLTENKKDVYKKPVIKITNKTTEGLIDKSFSKILKDYNTSIESLNRAKEAATAAGLTDYVTQVDGLLKIEQDKLATATADRDAYLKSLPVKKAMGSGPEGEYADPVAAIRERQRARRELGTMDQGSARAQLKKFLGGEDLTPEGYAHGGLVHRAEGSPVTAEGYVLEPTFGERMGANVSDFLMNVGIKGADLLPVDKSKMSAAHRLYLDTFGVKENRAPVTKEYFNQEEMDALSDLISRKGGTKGSMTYDDYKKFLKDRPIKEYSLTSGQLDPYVSISKSLGQFNYEYDPKTKSYKIIDEYDFNPLPSKSGIRSDSDFIGDYISEDDDLIDKLRLYAGRKLPPGTGRKVDLSVPAPRKSKVKK